MELINYINQLSTEAERSHFAKRCGTTIGRMRKECYRKDGPRFSARIAVRIEAESGRSVSRYDLRADAIDIWGERNEQKPEPTNSEAKNAS
jgi:hypothetical protein